MEREKIEALIDELKGVFNELNLNSPYKMSEKRCEDLSMHILLPDHWQKVKWAVEVCRRYDLENSTDNALLLTECDIRNLAKHILSQGKYPPKGERVQHASIH